MSHDILEFRCPDHPDSVQHFVGPFWALTPPIRCHWVTRAVAGNVRTCDRVLTATVRVPDVLPVGAR